jgi:hypothetical protein
MVISLRIYKRNRVTLRLILFNSILAAVVGSLYLNSNKTITAIIWFIIAVGWGIRYFWSVKYPIFRITKDELIINRKISEPNKTVKLKDIIEVNIVSQKLLYLVTKNGTQTKVKPKQILSEQRKAFVDNMNEVIKTVS